MVAQPAPQGSRNVATILVEEDEQPVRELLGMLLEDAGHRVLRATHGRQGLELAQQERPDLVISDIMMPVLDGVELCHHLKADSGTQPIPVILMSAAGERLARGAGAEAFISKPFDLDEMEALVEQWLPPGEPH